MEGFINLYNQIDVFLLVLIRIISFISVVPLFSLSSVPAYAKIGLSFFIALILFSVIPFESIAYNESILNYAFLVIKEIFVGWLIGFGVYLTFTIITLAGQFIDHHIGFTMVNVFDPLSQIQLSISANFYYYILLLLMLVTNMHYFLIQGLVEAFKLIPLGGVSVNPSLYQAMIQFMTDYFIIAFKISGPIFAAILIVNIILGILARTAPQMNMFVVGMPLKIYVGLFIMVVTIFLMPAIADFIFDKMLGVMDQLIKGLST